MVESDSGGLPVETGGEGAGVARGERLATVGWRTAPAALAVVLTSLLVRLAAGEDPNPVVPVVYGSDMLDIVSPLWLRLLSQWLARPQMVLSIVAGVVALLVVARRAGPRPAVLGGVVWLGANLTVQGIKHGILPIAPGVVAPQLSGHTAVASGAAFAVVLAVSARWRARAAALAAVAVAAIGVGVVLVGWHTPVQSLASVLVTFAWLAACRPRRSAGTAGGSVGLRVDPVSVRT